MKNITFVILIAILAFLVCACDNKMKELENEKFALVKELEIKNKKIDSLKISLPMQFNEALKIESADTHKAIELYKNICKSDEGSYWSKISEQQILKLSKEQNSKSDNLKDLFIWGSVDTLVLIHNNSKCGEWGGDKETIRIYLYDGKLLADYQKQIYECDDLSSPALMQNPPFKLQTDKKNSVSIKSENIIRDCFLDLLEDKLNNTGLVSHAGCRNTIELKSKDKKHTFFIESYSDFFYWSSFQALKKEIQSIQ